MARPRLDGRGVRGASGVIGREVACGAWWWRRRGGRGGAAGGGRAGGAFASGVVRGGRVLWLCRRWGRRRACCGVLPAGLRRGLLLEARRGLHLRWVRRRLPR